MHSVPPLFIIGYGDHAWVVRDIAIASGRVPAGFLEFKADASDTTAVRSLVPADEATIGAWHAGRRGAEFVVAIGANDHRARVFAHASDVGLTPVALIHPSASLLGGCVVSPGAQICAGAVIGVDARIGPDAIINTAASVDHHNVIEAHTFIAPGAHLAGRVTVREGAHVGIGASVREGVTIGAWSYVGAGAAVIADVPPRERWAGVPARPMPLSEISRTEP